MNTIYTLTISMIFSVGITYSADNNKPNRYSHLSEVDRSKLEDCIKQIDFIYRVGNSYFVGSGMGSVLNAVRSQIYSMETILDSNGIPHSGTKTPAWVEGMRKDLIALRKSDVAVKSDTQAESTICDIAGLDKASVLKALVDRAVCNLDDSKRHSFSNKDVSLDECKKAVADATDFDYFNGKPLKVNLSGDQFDAYLYNRDNGSNAAQKAIAQLKKSLGNN